MLRPDVPKGGFTLLELLVVVTLLGVLSGIGVGFLRRTGDELEVALSMVRDQVRIAAFSARTRHLPSEVVVDPGQDGPSVVRARVLEPVGGWHMERDPRADDAAGLPYEVSGTVEPGRFGMARRIDPETRRGVLLVDTGSRPVFDLRDGFAVRIDVKLDERIEAMVARLGTSLELQLDDDLIPSAKMVGTEGGGQANGSTRVVGSRPLSPGRWHTLQVVHDGSYLRLLVDDREVDAARASLPILQTDKDVFEVSPPDMPVEGLVDEVVVLAYSFSDAQMLPPGVRVAFDRPSIAFDREGGLIRPTRIAIVLDDDERLFQVGPGGTVE